MSESGQVPALLLNSPYGGRAWANVSLPDGYLPGHLNRLGTQESNGGAAWDGFEAIFTSSLMGNVTSWGPGPNVRCTQLYSLAVAPGENDSLGIPLLGPGNVSDLGEPTTVAPNAYSFVLFQNGFNASNAPSVTTCGGSSESLPPVQSTSLELKIRFGAIGRSGELTYNFPSLAGEFHYWLPANFGTWQVDNLSASGGPGGGWAFSYSPCA